MSVVRLPRSMSTEQGSGRKATWAVSPDTQPSLFDKVIRVFRRAVTRRDKRLQLPCVAGMRAAMRVRPRAGQSGVGDAAYQWSTCSTSASGRRAAGRKVSPV